VKAMRIAKKNYNKIAELIPAMASTILVNATTGFLIATAYIIYGAFGI